MALYEFDDLLTALPELAQRIWVEELSGVADLQRVLDEVGLPDPVEFLDGGPRAYHELKMSPIEDLAAAEKRLRSAITRKVGKPGGGMKSWDIGSFSFSLDLLNGYADIAFASQYSLAQLRRAAVDWFAGAPGKEWMVRHYLIESADAQPNERGFLTKPQRVTDKPLAKIEEDGRVRVALSLGPGAKPPGVKAKNDEEALENLIAYLRDALGDPDPAPTRFSLPVWTKGTRSLDLRVRKGNRSRSFTFEGM